MQFDGYVFLLRTCHDLRLDRDCQCQPICCKRISCPQPFLINSKNFWLVSRKNFARGVPRLKKRSSSSSVKTCATVVSQESKVSMGQDEKTICAASGSLWILNSAVSISALPLL